MRAVSLILASLNASLASCSSFVNAHLASATQGPARAAAAAGGSRLVEAEIRSAGFHPQARSSCTARPARDNKCYAHYARTSQEKKAAGEFKEGCGGHIYLLHDTVEVPSVRATRIAHSQQLRESAESVVGGFTLRGHGKCN